MTTPYEHTMATFRIKCTMQVQLFNDFFEIMGKKYLFNGLFDENVDYTRITHVKTPDIFLILTHYPNQSLPHFLELKLLLNDIQ